MYKNKKNVNTIYYNRRKTLLKKNLKFFILRGARLWGSFCRYKNKKAIDKKNKKM